jgi:small subunit ribosomal protein S18
MADNKKQNKRRRAAPVPQECFFCKEKKAPAYADVSVLQRFTSDRGRILARLRTGVCAKHQRRLTEQIKYARHLALISFAGHD